MSRNLSLDHLGDFLQLSESDREEESDNRLRLEQLKQTLRQVIRLRLTPRQQEMLTLYYFERKKIPEIARELNVNKSTVSRTLNRAVENIRRYLEFYSFR